MNGHGWNEHSGLLMEPRKSCGKFPLSITAWQALDTRRRWLSTRTQYSLTGNQPLSSRCQAPRRLICCRSCSLQPWRAFSFPCCGIETPCSSGYCSRLQLPVLSAPCLRPLHGLPTPQQLSVQVGSFLQKMLITSSSFLLTPSTDGATKLWT